MMDGRADADVPPADGTGWSSWHVVVLLASLVIACVTFSLRLDLPSAGVDASYVIGTYLAVTRHLQFGSDIIFNYGPLHLLESGTYFTTSQWLGYVLVTAVVPHVLLVWALAALVMREPRSVLLACLVAAASLLALPSLTPIKLALATALLFFLMVSSRRWTAASWVLVLVATSALALQGLTKFTTMYQGVAMVALAIA